MGSRNKSAQSLYFLGAMLCIVIAFSLIYSNYVRTQDLQVYWISTYLVFFLVIFFKVKSGKLVDPIVLVGSSFFLLLIVGSLAFELFKDRPLNFVVSNLIGVGFSSIMGGILIGTILAPSRLSPQQTFVVHNGGLVYVLGALGIMASMVMFIKFRGIPMLAADPNEAKVNFLSGNGIFNLFFKGMSIFALGVLYERYYSGKSLFLAHAYCFVVVLITLAAGYRSSSIVTLGAYIALYLIITRTQIPFVVTASAALSVVLFLTMWGAFRRGTNGMSALVSELDMVVNGRPVIIETILRNFDTHDFFGGSLYYSDFKRFLPGVQVNANVDLKYAIFPTAESMPENAGITPSIVGEAYMNFGDRGVFWILLLTGLIVGYCYKVFVNKQNFLRSTFYLTLIFGIADAIQTGIGLKLVHLVQFWIWIILLGIIFEKRLVRDKRVVIYATTPPNS